MTDNIDTGDETFNDLTNPILETTPAENIPAIEQDNLLNHQQTENMEVHKHPHHVMHKKKWIEYVLEFFMLFLAVFLGFIAENIRESSVERRQEREYIHSMINDLKTDTSKLGKNITFYQQITLMQDTLVNTFSSLNTGFKEIFNRNINGVTYYPDFIYTDATIQQLKNSGGFRILKNHNDIDSIMAYDATVKSALILESDLNKFLLKMLDLTQETFNFQSLFEQILHGKSQGQLEVEKLDFLLTHDKVSLAKYYNHLVFYKNLCKLVVKPKMEQVKLEATKLINYLEKEYHLE